MPIGAYNPAWPDIHMNPEEAVRAHRDITDAAGLLVPIHWATFRLAPASVGRARRAAAGRRRRRRASTSRCPSPAAGRVESHRVGARRGGGDRPVVAAVTSYACRP